MYTDFDIYLLKIDMGDHFDGTMTTFQAISDLWTVDIYKIFLFSMFRLSMFSSPLHNGRTMPADIAHVHCLGRSLKRYTIGNRHIGIVGI